MKEGDDRDPLVHTRAEELERAGTLAVHDVERPFGVESQEPLA